MVANIFLIGFMGTGKTTVLENLVTQLGFKGIDIDKEIEKRHQMTISEIFASEGEDAFRKLETEMIEAFNDKSHYVISCGGGVPLRDRNVENMKKNGVVVLLCARPETVYHRVKSAQNRPLLDENMNISYISQMMDNRKAAYEAAADIKINTDEKNPAAIGAEICENLMNKNFCFDFLKKV